MPKLYFATDHAGFALKEALIPYVQSLGYETHDCGAHELDPADDYPDYIHIAAQAVDAAPESTRAIVLGGSGQAEAIVANRYSNVRCAVYYGGAPNIITLSREHNNANMLSLGARFITEDEARHAVQTWLATEFSQDERHVRRIAKIK